MLLPYHPPASEAHRAGIDNLLDLSVDGRQLAAARRVFFSRSWELIAGDATMLWGEYRVRNGPSLRPLIVVADAGLSCTCRAPQPCKHTLALLLFARQSSERMQVNHEPPLWVTERLTKKPDAPPPSTPDSPTRSLARDARQEKRLLAMQNGLDELETWLHDLVGNGMGHAGGLPPAAVESLAAGMVNAKLGGVARRLRALAPLLTQEEWPDQLAEAIACFFLFIRAFRRLDRLPTSTEHDLLRYAGVNIKKEEVLAGKSITDHWLVVGVKEGEEDGLRFRRVWLIGEKTKQVALLLDYAWGQQEFPDYWVTGMACKGQLVYYPGAWPVRAILRQHTPSQQAFDGPHGYAHFNDLRTAQQQVLAKAPLLYHFPALLEEVRPVQVRGTLFYLLDEQQTELPLADGPVANWQLLALSGGRPLTVFGEWDSHVFHPYAVIHDGRVVAV